MTTPQGDRTRITDRTPGEAAGVTERHEFLGCLALLAAAIALVSPSLAARFGKPSAPPGGSRPAGRLSVHPPSRSVKRRG